LRAAPRLLTRLGAAAPNLVWAAAFFAVPAAVMVVYSFAQQDMLTAEVSFDWTLANYERIGDSIILEALLRSLWLSGVATFFCLLVAYPVAYFLAFRAGRMKTVLLGLVIVPFLTSFVVRTYALVGVLGPQGALNDVLRATGLIDEPLRLLYNPTAIVIGIVYNYLPLMILTLYVALDRIDRRVLEAARDLGAGTFNTFRRVIFPQAMPGMIAGVIVVGAPAAGEYVIPTILGGGKTLMFGNIVADQFGSTFAWPYGAALSVLLTGVLLVLIFAALRLSARRGNPVAL
jgi:ABC-type spermidine/putrescine transport system permease subunit I